MQETRYDQCICYTLYMEIIVFDRLKSNKVELEMRKKHKYPLVKASSNSHKSHVLLMRSSVGIDFQSTIIEREINWNVNKIFVLLLKKTDENEKVRMKKEKGKREKRRYRR